MFSFLVVDLMVDLYKPAAWQPGSSRKCMNPGAADRLLFVAPHHRALPGDPFVQIDGDVRLHVLAGRPDPDNPTRFVIPYECDGQPGRIEGQLTDSDTIYWERITGPLKPLP